MPRYGFTEQNTFSCHHSLLATTAMWILICIVVVGHAKFIANVAKVVVNCLTFKHKSGGNK